MGWAPPRQGPWVWTDGRHLWCEDTTKLCEFATRCGMRSADRTDHRIPHFIVRTRPMRKRVLLAGAVFVSSRGLIEQIRRAE